MPQTNYREKHGGNTLIAAVAEVFGRWPLWPWSVLGVIVGGGVIGLGIAPLLAPTEGSPDPALRWAAVMGYGLAVGAVIALVPRLLKLQQLSRDLRQRPDGDSDWWPYQLLAAALIDVPALRATTEDFSAAVDRARIRSRGMLAARLWPITVTAFVIPVLGLISGWESGRDVISSGDIDRTVIYAEILSAVAPPMVVTIVVALAVMLAIVATDQWTRSLLAGWANSVRFADGELPLVQMRLEQSRPSPREATDVLGAPFPVPPPVPSSPLVEESVEPTVPQISVDKFEDLKDAFRRD